MVAQVKMRAHQVVHAFDIMCRFDGEHIGLFVKKINPFLGIPVILQKILPDKGVPAIALVQV